MNTWKFCMGKHIMWKHNQFCNMVQEYIKKFNPIKNNERGNWKLRNWNQRKSHNPKVINTLIRISTIFFLSTNELIVYSNSLLILKLYPTAYHFFRLTQRNQRGFSRSYYYFVFFSSSPPKIDLMYMWTAHTQRIFFKIL